MNAEQFIAAMKAMQMNEAPSRLLSDEYGTVLRSCESYGNELNAVWVAISSFLFDYLALTAML